MIKLRLRESFVIYCLYFSASLEKSGQGNTLVLRLVTGADTGEYTCTVSAATPIRLTHSLTVRGESTCHEIHKGLNKMLARCVKEIEHTFYLNRNNASHHLVL